ARVVEGVEVGAIAARDRGRASAFAEKHGVPAVHDSYADLLADPSLDAIYVPLPNGLHARWALAALEAGKHVLCEKPFTANAARVTGERGTLRVNNFAAPHLWSSFTVEVAGRRRRERFTGGEATYVHQLRAFAAAVRGEPTNLTPPADSVATMELIDDIYTK